MRLIHINDENLDFAYSADESINDQDESPFLKHFHDGYEFYFLIDGDVEYSIENRMFRPKPNSLIVTKPAQFHFLKFPSNKIYKRIVITASEKIIPNSLLGFIKNCGPLYHFMEKNEIPRLYLRFINTIAAYTDEDQIYAMHSLFRMLLLELKYSESEIDENALHYTPIIGKVMQFVNENIANEISAEILAKALYVSESYLNHTFNKTFPISLMQYVKHKKMLYAKNLLQSGMGPVDVAEQCGYSHYPTFFRTYKLIMKKTPKADQNNPKR